METEYGCVVKKVFLRTTPRISLWELPGTSITSILTYSSPRGVNPESPPILSSTLYSLCPCLVNLYAWLPWQPKFFNIYSKVKFGGKILLTILVLE